VCVVVVGAVKYVCVWGGDKIQGRRGYTGHCWGVRVGEDAGEEGDTQGGAHSATVRQGVHRECTAATQCGLL
jgi:hypothetical protein